MVKVFVHYFWLVLKRCFEGAFLIADAFGLLFLFLSRNQPNVPGAISLSIFGVIFIISTFVVWYDETEKTRKIQVKLDKINHDIPKYQLSTGPIESYSITKLIEEYTSQLDATERRITKQSTTDSTNSSMATMLKSFSRLSVLPAGLSGETVEEKADRLANHLGSLERYENEMRQTYKLPIFFESSRSDNNVEFEIEASHNATLFVKDDHPIRDTPRTHTPSPYGSDMLRGIIPGGRLSNANRLYQYSYDEGSKAFSKLNKINANRKYDLFDEDFYIQTDQKSIELKISVHSEKLNQEQLIRLTIDLSEVSLEEISSRSQDE